MVLSLGPLIISSRTTPKLYASHFRVRYPCNHTLEPYTPFIWSTVNTKLSSYDEEKNRHAYM
jgi:hypothetical protein